MAKLSSSKTSTLPKICLGSGLPSRVWAVLAYRVKVLLSESASQGLGPWHSRWLLAASNPSSSSFSFACASAWRVSGVVEGPRPCRLNSLLLVLAAYHPPHYILLSIVSTKVMLMQRSAASTWFSEANGS